MTDDKLGPSNRHRRSSNSRFKKAHIDGPSLAPYHPYCDAFDLE
jgi:hypothetical protein